MNPLLFPPTLIKRALDDLAALADAARRLPALEEQVIGRIDRVEAAGLARIDALIEELRALRSEMAPVGQLTAVRDAVEPLDARLLSMQARLDAVKKAVEPISQLKQVREGIEPLDDDMRAVRESVDDLEPLMREVSERLEAMREDLAPLGQLADKVPGIG